MRERQLEKIKCPKCKAEYLPAEIFIPNAFFGKPRNIEKDADGKIINFMGQSIDNKETYKCDYCNTRFKVYCNLAFNCIEDSRYNFEDYSTQLTTKQFELEEL